MRINGKSIGIFVLGSAVGAVVSAIVTRKVVDKVYREAADEEIYKAWQESKKKMDELRSQNKDLSEKIKQQSVTIQALADQIRTCGGTPELPKEEEDDDTEDDIRHSVHKSDGGNERDSESNTKRMYRAYSRLYDRAEAEFPMEDEVDGEMEEDIIERSGPRAISEDEFSCTCLDYGKEDLHYYMFDGKMLSDDGELIDEPSHLIGTDWKVRCRNAGDEVYIRNDRLQADYRVIFTAGAGENNMTLVSDDWD